MVHIFYTKFHKPLAARQWLNLVHLLPPDLRLKSKKYRRWQDQHAFVLGKMLLLRGLTEWGFEESKIGELQYNRYGKPFINDCIDFNISHSGDYVVCALGENMELGIDIEMVADIDFDDFANVMTGKQWSIIHRSQNPKEEFFRFWTVKESVIKAEERGMSIPLLDIHLNDGIVCYRGKKWYLKELDLDMNLCGCLATSIQDPPLSFFKVDFEVDEDSFQLNPPSGKNDGIVMAGLQLKK